MSMSGGNGAVWTANPYSQGAAAAPRPTPTQVSDATIAKVVSALLMGADPYTRSSILNSAKTMAKGPKVPMIPWMAGIPNDATPEQTVKMMNGFGAMILALGSSGGEDTVPTILQKANSLATGQPYSGDPGVVSPTESTAAHTLLAASLIDDEVAKEVMATPSIMDALMATVEKYDCAIADVYLGGEPGPLEGGFFSNLWQGIKNWAAGTSEAAARAATMSEAEKAAEEEAKTLETKVAQLRTIYPNKSEAELKYEAAVSLGLVPSNQTEEEQATTTAYLTSLKPASTDDPYAVTAAALNDFREQLRVRTDQMAAIKASAQQTAKDMAKMQWAESFLSAPDDVVDILLQVEPVNTTPKQFLSSMLALLPAAKQTGSVSTISALSSAIKSALNSGSLPSSVSSLFSGDPQNDFEAEVMNSWAQGDGDTNMRKEVTDGNIEVDI